MPPSTITILCHDPLRADIDDVQELTETHEGISRAKTAIQHRILTHYLPLYFPEVERFRGNSRSDWFFAFLEQFPTPESITALSRETFIAEAGDLRRFGHHRQFLKFCGLDLATRQSGLFRGQTELPKYGNARLRRTLWLAGQVAIRQRDNDFRDKFERYIARDRHNADLRRKALTAITAWMARVVLHKLVVATESDLMKAGPGGRGAGAMYNTEVPALPCVPRVAGSVYRPPAMRSRTAPAG